MDDFGHKLNLRYKGEETLQSWQGGALSILVQVLTFVIVIIGAQKVFDMKDPQITQILRPLEEDESLSITNDGISFTDYDFNIGFTMKVSNKKTGPSFKLPESVARFKVIQGPRYKKIIGGEIPLKPCT